MLGGLNIELPSSQLDRVFCRRLKVSRHEGKVHSDYYNDSQDDVLLSDLPISREECSADDDDDDGDDKTIIKYLKQQLMETKNEIQKLQNLFSDCTITEFSCCDIPKDITSADIYIQCDSTDVIDVGSQTCFTQDCSSCLEYSNRIFECERMLSDWHSKKSDFTLKEAECQRLRTILNFSQLKKDSDRMRAAEADALSIRKELGKQASQARYVKRMQLELDRLRDVEKEYTSVREALAKDRLQAPTHIRKRVVDHESRRLSEERLAMSRILRGDPSTQQRRTNPTKQRITNQLSNHSQVEYCHSVGEEVIAAAPPTPPAAVDDQNTSFGTICCRMQEWIKNKKKAEAVKEQKQPNKSSKETTKRHRVSSAPPGGRKSPVPVIPTDNNRNCGSERPSTHRGEKPSYLHQHPPLPRQSARSTRVL